MRLHLTTVLLTIASGLLTNLEVEAQARGQPFTESRRQARSSDAPAANPAQQLADLHAWLGRLVGRFQGTSSWAFFESTTRTGPGGSLVIPPNIAQLVNPPDPSQRYVLQCFPVGSGSGVLCLYEATARTVGEVPLARLFGVDAERLLIRVLEISARGQAYESFGPLRGDTVILERTCQAAEDCVGISTMRIRAPPGKRFVDMYSEVNVRASRISFRSLRVGARHELRRE